MSHTCTQANRLWLFGEDCTFSLEAKGLQAYFKTKFRFGDKHENADTRDQLCHIPALVVCWTHIFWINKFALSQTHTAGSEATLPRHKIFHFIHLNSCAEWAVQALPESSWLVMVRAFCNYISHDTLRFYFVPDCCCYIRSSQYYFQQVIHIKHRANKV